MVMVNEDHCSKILTTADMGDLNFEKANNYLVKYIEICPFQVLVYRDPVM